MLCPTPRFEVPKSERFDCDETAVHIEFTICIRYEDIVVFVIAYEVKIRWLLNVRVQAI